VLEFVGQSHFSTRSYASELYLTLERLLKTLCEKSEAHKNRVLPGYIITDMFRRFLDPDDRVTGRPFLYATPTRRYGTAAEAAALAVWLCSDEAIYITGQSIAVDGGLTVPGNRLEITS
jgi:NAD(P)-dependent dehydrogenase (short-subunit alcohol dehydrogenase family)